MSSSGWLAIITTLTILGLYTVLSVTLQVLSKVIDYFTMPVALNAEALNRMATALEEYNEILSRR